MNETNETLKKKAEFYFENSRRTNTPYSDKLKQMREIQDLSFKFG